ncbi:LysM peptidoglycan-binding domain-containing protein [Embleya sp. NPDC059259]|uniref:CIS tube protein n=1 Tax=unclassified Embleya TaxID=2699296 RepID=UPI003689726E
MVTPLPCAPVRATLVVHDPPAGPGNTPGPERARLRLHFNPDRITLARGALWDRTRFPSGADVPRPQFIAGDPRVMTLEVFVDSGDGRSDVQDAVDLLLSCCSPTPQSAANLPASAPWIRLEWGRSRTAAFLAYLRQVEAAYTRFAADGTPLRARCSLTLEEIGGATARQNPTSGADGPTGTHTLAPGDTLQHVAWNVYGDPTRWRAIARANDIDDPTRLTPGTTLIVPVLEDTSR